MRRRHRLDHRELADAGPARWVTEHCHTRHAGRNLLEQFQPFPGEAVFKLSEAGSVAARPRHAFDKSRTDWIDDLRKHDREGTRHLQHRLDYDVAGNEAYVRRKRDQLRRKFPNTAGVVAGPADVDS